MIYKTFEHLVPDVGICKFTIFSRYIGRDKYYYAKFISVDLDTYKAKSEIEKRTEYGIEITDGNQRSVNYKDPKKLINDIKEKYGHEWLKTEI